MKMRLFAVLAALFVAPAAFAADLIVTVTGVTQTTGTIRVVTIFDPDGVARQGESRNLDASTARDGVITTRFKGLAPTTLGVVAVEEASVNHAIEKAFKGGVAAPAASSAEVRVVLAEPSMTVTVPLAPSR